MFCDNGLILQVCLFAVLRCFPHDMFICSFVGSVCNNSIAAVYTECRAGFH